MSNTPSLDTPWSVVWQLLALRSQTKFPDRISDRQKLALMQLAENEQTEIVASYLYGS
jgi:hypothetical protein